MRLVQLHKSSDRCVAVVDEPHLHVLAGVDSVYALACEALATGTRVGDLARARATGERLDYDSVYSGASVWRLAVPVDHPVDQARCLVSGTGLTHFGSAKNRDAMHNAGDSQLTDSMKMFRAGVEGGRPADDTIGAAPEWFYKGSGAILRSPGDPLVVPTHALDGGEEAEIAGVYLIDRDGRPRRLGMAMGNEFSDHRFERTNYLNLAGSKLRTCALGPELVLDPAFTSIRGRVTIERAGQVVWEKDIATGEAEMCHSLANIEHHHFKFEGHRRPLDLHVHFFGAHSLSAGDGVTLVNGDVMVIAFDGFGRPLRNPILYEDTTRARRWSVAPL